MMQSPHHSSHHPPCPVCNSTVSTKLIQIQEVPVFCNMLWDRREKALKAARGDIDLVFCHTCAHVYNAAFDASRMQYNPQYETALDYSPTFQKYTRKLAQRLASTYQLQGKKIIEVGCGKGEFLRLLADIGQNRCLGFDPSYNSRQADTETLNSPISIIQDYYSEQYADHRADFVVCRQVLEHIREPAPFLKMIHSGALGHDDAVIFVEVPNAMFTLRQLGIWDLIYEHCSYFTALSLKRLFVETGLNPINIEETYGGQYLCIEARPPAQNRKQDHISLDLSFTEVENDVQNFAENYRQTISEWRKNLAEIKQSGARPVVWGAGSKGITFMNVLPGAAAIDCVIDINPHKQGLYVPGTGQQVVSPERLPEIRPDVIIVMNPLYLDEIDQMITDLNLRKDRDVRLMPVNL
ncbi:MAG: class I SAM-dependent methyltransferase [Desulfobacterales bacterium]